MDRLSTRVAELVETLDLRAHPEGGYFGEVHRSHLTVVAGASGLERSALTSIYFLLGPGQHSSWHRVGWDEVWHHYEGGPLEHFTIDPERRTIERRVLGPVDTGVAPVLTVPAGHWQAARPLADYTLAGCTVGPGFEFDDFMLIRRDESSRAFLEREFADFAALL